jgi:hypothetical protein
MWQITVTLTHIMDLTPSGEANSFSSVHWFSQNSIQPDYSLPFSQKSEADDCPEQIECSPHPISLTSILWQSHILQGYHNFLFLLGFPTTSLCPLFFCQVLSTCPVNLIYLDLPNLIFGECSLWSSLSRNFLQAPLYPAYLATNRKITENPYNESNACRQTYGEPNTHEEIETPSRCYLTCLTQFIGCTNKS